MSPSFTTISFIVNKGPKGVDIIRMSIINRSVFHKVVQLNDMYIQVAICFIVDHLYS